MNGKEVDEIVHSPHPDLAFTRLWTMKEAVLKLSGEGIRDDIKNVLTDIPNHFTTVVNQRRGYVYSVVY